MKSARHLRQFALRFAVTLAVSVGVAGVVTPVFAQAPEQAAPFASDRLSVEVMGQGPDVILLHGYASTKEVWRAEAERLSGQYRVHLIQLSGFAGTAWTHGDGPYLQPMLDDLGRYAATLDQPAMIGHSMGGLAGLMLAQQQLEVLSRIMSVDSLPFFGALMDPTATPDTMRPVAQQMAAMIKNTPAFILRAQQQQTAASMTLKAERRAEIVAASDSSDRQVLATAISELMVADARPGLSQMRKPVWAVYAVDRSTGGEPVSPAVWAREYASLPTLRLEPVENSRHFIMFDQPERLSALIDQFLSENP